MIGYAPAMRLSIIAGVLLVLSTPVFADIVVSKKVTKLETKDKTVTNTTVLIAVPSVNACFSAPIEIDVDLVVDTGKVSVTTDRSNKDLASCLEDRFRKMKAKGTYTARVHLVAKPDPRQKAADDKKTAEIVASLDKLDTTTIAKLDTSGTGSGAFTGGNGVASGDFVASSNSKPPRDSSVAVGSPDGSLGDYTADEIQRVFMARAGVLRACYQMTLKSQPKLSGKLTYEIQIGKDGTVTKVKLKSSTAKSAKLDQCLSTQLKRMKFVAKGSTATVMYPLVFQQQE